MIALETCEKMNKSPRKPKVEIQLSNDEFESSDDTDNKSGDEIEENDVESADEGDAEDESGSENAESVSDVEEKHGTNSDDEDDRFKANPGWADAMQKILRTKKPKRKKTIVLSKAKRLCDVVLKEKKESPSFQVEGDEKNAQIDKPDPSDTSQVKKDREAEHGRRKRREVDLGIRVKPTVLDKEREKILQKIATKGVVQLFNAVRQQQKDIDKRLEEAGPLERKREIVLKNIDKRAFLDVLMGGAKSVSVDNPVKSETREKDRQTDKGDNEKTWDVLRDDFMMGAKLKDWDKNIEDDAEADSSAPEEMDSDE